MSVSILKLPYIDQTQYLLLSSCTHLSNQNTHTKQEEEKNHGRRDETNGGYPTEKASLG